MQQYNNYEKIKLP